MKRFVALVSILLPALLLPSVGMASLINTTVLDDTPIFWHGYVDWTQPSSVSSQTLDSGPNWTAQIIEVATGGGAAVLIVTAQHLVTPHAPPNPPATFLVTTFGPGVPGLIAGPTFFSQPHFDDPEDFDQMRVQLTALNATTSRVDIQLMHGVPEPGTLGLIALGGLLLGSRRWRFGSNLLLPFFERKSRIA